MNEIIFNIELLSNENIIFNIDTLENDEIIEIELQGEKKDEKI